MSGSEAGAPTDYGTGEETGGRSRRKRPDRGGANVSPTGPTVEFQVHFRRGERGRRRLRKGARPSPPAVPPGRIPRVSRLLALAIRFDELIRQGAVRDYAELARLGGVTRARISQIMDLLNLAPDIQEEILFLPRESGGRDRVTERGLREVVRTDNWEEQRVLYQSGKLSRGLQ